jgi:hypothetical protein
MTPASATKRAAAGPGGATTAHTARATRRRTAAARPPRRVSGPAGGRRARPAASGGAVAVAPPLGLRVARAGGRIVDARFLDRLLRGGVWIALLALGLMGIVFIQVSMLRLNAGISRAITSAETLHRQNATLRADISRLDSGDRIADAARALGMIQPPAGSVNYLDARRADGDAAARAIRPPKPVKAPASTPASATTSPPAATAPVAGQTATAQAQAATAPPATAQQPAPATTPPAQQPTPRQATAPPAPSQAPTAATPAGSATATGQGGQ